MLDATNLVPEEAAPGENETLPFCDTAGQQTRRRLHRVPDPALVVPPHALLTDDLGVTGILDIAELRLLSGRIAASTPFRDSPRRREFLQFASDRALPDHLDEISEHQIGQAVFQRAVANDTANDNIVRVSARQLRDKLRDRLRDDLDDEGRGAAGNGCLVAMTAAAENNRGAEPERVLADAGCRSEEGFQQLAREGITHCVSLGWEGKAEPQGGRNPINRPRWPCEGAWRANGANSGVGSEHQ